MRGPTTRAARATPPADAAPDRRDVAGAGVTPADVAGVVEGSAPPGWTASAARPEPLRARDPPRREPREPIRRWRRLQGWIEAEAKSAEIYRRLVEQGAPLAGGRCEPAPPDRDQRVLACASGERPNASWAGRRRRLRAGDAVPRRERQRLPARGDRAREAAERPRRPGPVDRGGSAVGLIATLVLAGWALKEREHAQEETASAMRARDDELTAKKTLSDNNVKLNETNARLRKSDDRARALVRSFSLTDKAKGPRISSRN